MNGKNNPQPPKALVNGTDLARPASETGETVPTRQVSVPTVGTGTSSGAATVAEQQAQLLKTHAYPAFMASVVGASFAGLVESARYVAFLDQVMHDAGNPSDPIERMLVEQLSLSHLHIGLLHTKAATSRTADVAKTYLSAANRMQAEFRRDALALKELRSPNRTKSFTVVKQANVAAGDQQVALVTQRRSTRKKKHALATSRTELPTTPPGALTDDRVTQTPVQHPTDCRQPDCPVSPFLRSRSKLRTLGGQ
jgi:hypothetical protein